VTLIQAGSEPRDTQVQTGLLPEPGQVQPGLLRAPVADLLHDPETVIPRASRRRITGPQRVSGVLLAVVCVVGAVWYVPRIAAANGRSFTGTVSSSGLSYLNFANSGRVGKISVHLGQHVRAGRVLATESAQGASGAVTADRAAIAADKANIAMLRAQSTAAAATTASALAAAKANLATAGAQLAKDEANLVADRLKLQATEIIAPAAGTVVAVNGQVGETVTADGIKNYSAQSQPGGAQQPAFSLLPEGPKSAVFTGKAQAAMPVIVLRTSGAWQVVVPIPESSAANVRAGQVVIISVPSAHLSGVRGRIQELLPTPVTTSGGIVYQAVVNVLGHQRVTPLSGMAADVRLGS
jgi:multidrug efflux pump subunit AcrA (membrane-fusion protein)